MRVLISADMEGASGVTGSADVRVGSPEWQECRDFLTSDVNAAVEGFFDAGATSIVVNESHATCRNLKLDQLDPRVTVIRGRPKPLGMMEGIDSDVAAVAFVGYHGGAGGSGVLSHTFMASGIVGVKLNGCNAGEGGLNAALASEYGVPVVLVTGDDAACQEAQEYAPQSQRVIVKWSRSRFAAECLAPSSARQLIRESAGRALSGTGWSRAELTGPHRIDITFASSSAALSVTAMPTVEYDGSRTVSFVSQTMRQASRMFKAATVLASDAIDPLYG